MIRIILSIITIIPYIAIITDNKQSETVSELLLVSVLAAIGVIGIIYTIKNIINGYNRNY